MVETVSDGKRYEFSNIDRDELPALQGYVQFYVEERRREAAAAVAAASHLGGGKGHALDELDDDDDCDDDKDQICKAKIRC